MHLLAPLTLFCVLAPLAAANSPTQDDPPKTETKPAAAAPAEKPSFESLILAAAAEYKQFPRVSDRANWAPAMCRVPPPTGVQQSEAPEPATGSNSHGRKLYFLFAKDDRAYDAMSMSGTLGYPRTTDPDAKPWSNPVGQTVVKEAFKPSAVSPDKRPADETDTFGQKHLPAEYLELNGTLYRTGDPAGLFIMIKLDPATPETDNGWIYGVTSPDNKSVVASGRIASCMGCHEQTTRDRLYGHKWSWPRDKDGKPAWRSEAPPKDALPSK